MATWRDDKILELANQLTYSPAEKRHEQLAAAVGLLPNIDAERTYPWDFVHFRITGFQPVKHIDHVVCVIYAPGTLNGNAGVIGGSATAFSGTALQSAIVSNVNPANNQFVEYPLSGITDGATYQATFTSKLINLNDLGKGTGYTCDANGYPVYNFSQCK